MPRRKTKKKQPLKGAQRRGSDGGRDAPSQSITDNLFACIIPVGGPCNNRCRFCHPPGSAFISAEEIFHCVSTSPQRFVIIEGPGEPFINNSLERLVHTARRAGAAKLALLTNGRMFSYPPVSSLAAHLKPDVIAVSLLHTRPDVHDQITRSPDSFVQTAGGLKNLLKYRDQRITKIFLRFVPLDENMDQLAPLSRFVKNSGLDGMIIDPTEEGPRLTEKFLREMVDLKRSGEILLTREEFEKTFRAASASLYSEEGSAPARLHEKEKSLSLVIRTGCKNACNFCTTRIIQEENVALWPLDYVEFFFDDIQRARKKGVTRLKMVAIEPLEHPEIDKLIGFAKAAGFKKIEAWTSGRALADSKWAEQIARAGLTDVDIPLMGSSAEVHEQVALSRGAYHETMEGIENLRKLKIACKYHFIITKQNLEDMHNMLALGEKLGLGPPASVLIPSPSSENLASYRVFMPSYTDLGAVLKQLPKPAAAALLSRGLLNNVPPCIILAARQEFAPMINRYKPVKQEWIRDGNLSEPGAKLKIRAKCIKSKECRLADVCVGYHAQYESLFGTAEFRPLKK